MKILEGRRAPMEEYPSIERYAQIKLDGSVCDGGITEATAATAQNTSGALGRLLDFLAAKGIVTAADVEYIVEDSHFNYITFGD